MPFSSRFSLLLCCGTMAILLGGCSTTVNKEYAITGSNKSTGDVELSFDYKPREIPKVALDQPENLAAQRCQSWGYSRAVITSTSQESCIANEGVRCLRMRSVIRFKCD